MSRASNPPQTCRSKTGRPFPTNRAAKCANSSPSRKCRRTSRARTNPMSEFRAAAEAARAEALALLERGEFQPALAAYDRALEAANATNDPAFSDWMFVCRAAAAAEVGPADQELVELKCVLLRTLDPGTSFRAAYTAARIYEIRRNYARAASYNARARSLVAKLDEPLLTAASENQAGSILAADSRFAEAADSYRRCLD